MVVESKDIWIPFLIGLIVNALSSYLFLLEKLSLIVFIFILAGSFIVILIIGIQLKTNKILDELERQKLEQKRFDERFKIYERLLKIESEVFK